MAKKKKKLKPKYKDELWDPTDLCEISPEELIEAVKAEGAYSYDLETTGLSPRKDRIDGIAFYVPNEKNPERKPIRAWFPFADGTMDHTVEGGKVVALRATLDQFDTMTRLRPIWGLKDVIAIRHNGIFDDAFIYLSSGLDENIIVENIIADSMLADYVADERRKRYGLKLRVEQVFGHKMTSYKEAAAGQASFAFAMKKPLGVYACDDTAWTYRLWRWAMESIRKQDPPREHKDQWCSPLDDTPGIYSDLEKVFWKIEMRIQRILMEMEITGCFIDWEWLVVVQERLQKQKKTIEEEIKEEYGWMPKIRSPKQTSDFLYNPVDKGGIGLPTQGVDYNAVTDQYATGDKAIKHRAREFPVVAKILKYRSLGVVESSFCQKLIGLAQAETRIYARFRQTGTVIGRLSCLSGMSMLSIRLNGANLRRLVKLSELGQFIGSDVRIITHKGRERRVLNLFNKGPGLMFEVVADDGSKIRCTRDHKFFTNSGWRALKDIKRGDRLLRAEVCEAQEADKRQAVGAGSTVVLQGVRGRQEAGLQEVENLWSDGWDCTHVQGDLRLGDRCVPRPFEATSGLRRDTSTCTDMGATRQVQRLHTLQGVVQGDLRRQRPDAGEGEEDLRDISPGHDPGREDLQGVPRPTGDEARTTPERGQTEGGGVLSKVGFGGGDVRGEIPSRDRGQVRRGGVDYFDGHVPPRSIREPSRNHVVGEPIDGQRVLGTGRTEPTNRRASNGPEDGFHRAGGGLSEADATSPLGQAERIDHGGVDREGDDREGSSNVRFKSGGDEAVPCADGGWNPASATIPFLQELAGRLRLDRSETTGRGRWRVAPEVCCYQGSGSEEDKEGEGAWLPSSEVHHQAGRQEPSYGDSGDRVRTWTRVTSITPVSVEDVWDLTVEGDHSYLAHGFVNKNSADPVNLMNQPREKDLIRKAFCAHLEDDYDDDRNELTLIDADYGQMELRMAAHLAREKNMIEVFSAVDGCEAGPDGGPCERYTFHECFACHTCQPPIELPDGTMSCIKCGATGGDIEHQKRCRHVDPHQRTSEDVGVPRNPLAKCLDGSTLLLGMQPGNGKCWIQPTTIEDLVGDIEPNEHRHVPVTTVTTSEGLATAHTALKRHNKQTKIIITRRAIVIATVDHRFQVLGEHGALDPNTPSYVHVPGRSLVEAQNLEKGMKLPFIDMGHEQSMDPMWHQTGRHGALEINPFTKEVQEGGPATIVLDEKWAYFAGIFAGDGCASGNSCSISHGHTPEYKEWRDTVREACDAVGLPTSMRGDKRQTAIGSRVVRRYLSGLRICEELGKGDQGAKIMRVPPWVLSGGPKMMWSYIAGIFDTDGTVGKKKAGTASFTTKSPEFAGQMAFMLRWLGMPVLCQPGFNKTYERWYYTVHVLGEGIERFARHCPMRLKEKVDRLHERAATIKRKCAPTNDEVIAVIDGGERTVYDFQIDTEDHLYNQGGLVGHNNANFGLLYRMGAPKFCVYAGLFDEDGKPRVGYGQELIEKWHAAYPGIAAWHERVLHQLCVDNYIAYTITRRRRRLDIEWKKNDYRAGTQAIQFKVSGSCQDLIKLAMIKLFEVRNQKVANTPPAESRLWKKFRFMIQVHDELIFEGPKAMKEELCLLVKECMEGAAKGMRIPFVADARAGRTWDELH